MSERDGRTRRGSPDGGTRFSVSLQGEAVSLLQRAFTAEQLGYDFVWVPDHLTDIPPATAIYDAWTVLAYVGARTENIMLGSGVTDTQRIHPAKTANIVATLDNLSGGRAILGIGSGEVMNTKPFGMEWEKVEDRIQRLREYIQVVQVLWSSSFDKQVSYHGKFYDFKEAHLGLPPFRKPRPPVYIGAFSSDSMLEIAGELADGWYPGSYFTPSSYREKAAVIHAAAKRAHREPGAINLMANVPTIFGDDNETMSIVRSALKRGLVINRYLLKLLGEQEAYEVVSKRLQYQLIAPTPAYADVLEKTKYRELPISDESLDKGIDQMMAVGTPAQCTEKIARFIKAGATTIHLGSIIIDDDEGIETFSKKVMPALKDLQR